MAAPKGNKYGIGNTRSGRPREYSDDLAKKGYEYLASCVDNEYEFHKTRSRTSNTFEEKVTVNIPTLEGLALHLGINNDTIYDWESKHKAFSEMTSMFRQVQADRLIKGTLSGKYNPGIAKLLLSKHGYREVTDVNNNIVIDTNKKPEVNNVLKKFIKSK